MYRHCSRSLPHIVVHSLVLILAIASYLWVPAIPALAQEQRHVVQRGESLLSIAKQYHVAVEDLMAVNGIANPDLIVVGQQLLIPTDPGSGSYGTPSDAAPMPGDEGYYLVQRGDTLSQIAKQNNMALDDLMRLNNITDPSTIYVGQRLRVTARATPVASEEQTQPQIADTIYVVKAGDTLYSIARAYDTTPQALMTANGLPHTDFVFIGQRLRIRSGSGETQAILAAAGAPADGKRWIEVNLTDQTLTAWQGDMAVLHTSISS